MKKVKITVMRIAVYDDLIAEYENPIEHTCSMKLGQTFIANGWEKPGGFCDSAWDTVSPFVMTLAYGGEDIYSGWMKNKRSAMISCNDGFRPVSFLLEAMDEEADQS
ncbi:MAG: TIGR04076 family protein [Clostridia bacterium]|nr:TIGR04076 family protein [Clostridia bacterium]